jgi:LacI family transcriptional regulator
MIGVVVLRLQDYVLATIYEGIDEAATEHGYFTVVSGSLDRPEAHRAKAEKLLDRRAGRLILGDATFEDPHLAERGVPFTLVSRRAPPHRSVTCDDYAGGRLVAENLVAAGRRTFGLIAGDPRTSTSRDRSAGFLDALIEHGIDIDPARVVTGGFEAGSMTEAKVLTSGSLPEAVLAVNDFAAIGARGVHPRRIPRS